MPIPSISEWLAIQTLLAAGLPERVAALEARLAAERAAAEPLTVRNAARQADAERLRAAIADIVAREVDANTLSAKHVRHVLERAGFAPLPALRTVQLHLHSLRQT